ncbi:hypothetical protein JCM31271_26770 [Halorubrum trueperi]
MSDPPTTESGETASNLTPQERLTKFDEFLLDQLRERFVIGVDTGEFDGSIEPIHDADIPTTTITGAHTRHIAINQSSDRLSNTMTRCTERHPLIDDQQEVAQ